MTTYYACDLLPGERKFEIMLTMEPADVRLILSLASLEILHSEVRQALVQVSQDRLRSMGRTG